jgi:hypothetical protein
MIPNEYKVVMTSAPPELELVDISNKVFLRIGTGYSSEVKSQSHLLYLLNNLGVPYG